MKFGTGKFQEEHFQFTMFGGSITLNSSKSKNSLDDSIYTLPGKCPAAFEYTAGLVCRIPDSAKEEIEKKNGLKFDLELARKQHERYIITLRKLKVNLFELEADETKPLLLFLDRKAVVRDGIAFIPRPPVADEQWEEEVGETIPVLILLSYNNVGE